MIRSTENCLFCGEPIKGRADKKFCDDQCRSNYNYSLTRDANNLVRNINRILKKNRLILEKELGNEKMKKTSRKKLLEKGFDFKFHTHELKTQKSLYRFCYEYGYLDADNEFVLIVKNPELLK
jgi:predicted nucleic acid-binding Zn ribbon protein